MDEKFLDKKVLDQVGQGLCFDEKYFAEHYIGHYVIGHIHIGQKNFGQTNIGQNDFGRNVVFPLNRWLFMPLRGHNWVNFAHRLYSVLLP